MRLTWLAACLLLLAAAVVYSQVSPSTQGEGRVTGVVVDEQNQPVIGAQVCTQVSRPGQIVGNCLAQTDTNGRFQMDHLPMGTTEVVAQKPQDGYTGQSPEIPTVTLTPEAPLANVTVKIGPREGILARSVKDKVTGKPVYDVRLRWYVDDPNSTSGYGGGGEISRWSTRMPIPAEKDVVISLVSARGYKELVPTDPSDPSRPLKLHVECGEVKSLSIELEPEVKDAPTAH